MNDMNVFFPLLLRKLGKNNAKENVEPSIYTKVVHSEHLYVIFLNRNKFTYFHLLLSHPSFKLCGRSVLKTVYCLLCSHSFFIYKWYKIYLISRTSNRPASSALIPIIACITLSAMERARRVEARGILSTIAIIPVSYTHLTLPTKA